MSDEKSEKSAVTTLLLCLFLGAFGIHRFYVGKYKTGILMLLTGGGLGIWTLVDLVMIACCEFKDSNGKYLIFTRGRGSPVKLVLKIIGCVFVAIIVYVVLLVSLIMFLTGSMIESIQNQLSALRAGDMNKAYSYLASETTSSVSLKDFEKYVANYPVLTQNKHASFPERQFENNKGYAKGVLESDDGKKTTVEYLLAKENGVWKISAIRVDETTQDSAQSSSGGTYEDKNNHYSIKYPKDWNYVQRSPNSVLFSGSDGTPSSISAVTIQSIPDKAHGGKYDDTKAAIDDIKRQVTEQTTNTKYLSSGVVELPSDPRHIKGQYFIATYSYQGRNLKKMQFVISRDNGGIIYAWSFVSTTSQYDKDLPIAKAMYESWEIK